MKKNAKKEKAKRYTTQEKGGWSGIRPVIFNESKYDAKKERRKGKEVCKNADF